jgi:glucosyl-3-phosphoglycerate synthase
VALHDCDILTFNRMMLARLIYPVTDPNFNYKFCKGYYYRADNDVLKGRVTRLLVSPLIRALRKFFPEDTFLEYIDSFRYPLAGEFSMRADVVKNIRIPSDWGLEVGILFDVQRNNAVSRICQVDIADRYDHKHQDLSSDDMSNGIAKMSFDISRTIFNKLASNGHTFTRDMFHSIHSTYFRIAQDFVERYHSDAVINGLSLDRHSEEEAVKLFADMIHKAGEQFLSDPTYSDFIPSWKRVNSAIPSFLKEMHEAVERDNAGEM